MSKLRYLSVVCWALLLSGVRQAGALEPRPIFNFDGDVQGWKLMQGVEQSAARGLAVDGTVASTGYSSLGVNVAFPGEAAVYTTISKRDTSAYEVIRTDLYLPADAPDDIVCYLFLQDGEWLWYQTRAHTLSPGEWHTISASIAPGSVAWESVGHTQPWGPLSRSNLNTIGVKLISRSEYAGRFNIDNVGFNHVMFPQHDSNVSRLSVGEKLELIFKLDTTYHNPFDPDEIRVDGTFTAPSGATFTVPGFFFQEYRRDMVISDQGARLEQLEPRGAPDWRIRFTPLEEGTHAYTITVSDHRGIRSSERRMFEVEPGDPPGFVQIDPDGGQGFVLDCGRYFFPIGLNYRSPYDVRYEQNILRQRLTNPHTACASSNIALDDGTFGFEENMEEMARYGMNFMETWLAPWWIALEWSPQRMGFRGAGRYNLRNAWRFDRVMDAAAVHGIYVQLVLINHGQLSTFCDAEWQDHPYNIRNGGFLHSPEEVFSDPRARQLTKNMLRYIVARWGYSPHIFSWDLLNEINLVGDSGRFWSSTQIVEWFREMAAYIKTTDPWPHMVTGHFTGNFDSDIFRLEDVDFSANNAYYNVGSQTLVSRLRGAYNFHRRFNKPFTIAEFGGTSGGGSVRNLRRDLQVGLWAGYTMPIAASPLFWWHQLVRDQDWHHQYDSMARFERIVGNARRFMDTFTQWRLTRPGQDDTVGGQMMHCAATGAYVGWFYNSQYLQSLSDDQELEEIRGASLHLPRIGEGRFRLLVWDTQSGEAVSDAEIVYTPDRPIELPPFRKDVAIFLQPLQG